LAKSDYLPFRCLDIPNRLQYRHADFKKFICDDLAMFWVHLVNFGPVTQFTKVRDIHPVISFLPFLVVLLLLLLLYYDCTVIDRGYLKASNVKLYVAYRI